MEKALKNKSGYSGITSIVSLPAIILMILVLLAGAAAAQAPVAGTVISACTFASYDLDGNSLTAQSNVVSTGVMGVHTPLLLPDGTYAVPAAERSAFSGEAVFFPFTLQNAGNIGDSFDLGIVFVNPSDFIPADTQIYLDLDGDGNVDSGETTICQAGPLGPGETADLILYAVIPSGAAGGDNAYLDITARSTGDTTRTDSGNIVRVRAAEEAAVPITIESDTPLVLPGDQVIFTVRYRNTGERAASDIRISDFIDYSGMGVGTEYAAGSSFSSLGGIIEYFDLPSSQWVEVEPSPERIKGIRLNLESLLPAQSGYLMFTANVDQRREYGDILNIASADYTGGDLQPYQSSSNEIRVLVGQVSSLFLGPRGNPSASPGTAQDRVSLSLNGADTVYTFWHDLLNNGNFTDTFGIALADSALIPPQWELEFVGPGGIPLDQGSRFTAEIGPVEMDSSAAVGLRVRSTPEGFRVFPGRELAVDLEAMSLVDGSARDAVQDVLAKTDIPILSVTQSIREPNAMIGDILSYIITVENVTQETTVDSVLLVESLSPGLGFAGGSDEPEIAGNILRWNLPTLSPGEKRQVIFRTTVKAGQERGELVSSAWVYGVSSLGERTFDGPADASVRIVEGIFTRRGIIFGSVFVDTDGDGRRARGEEGVVGVSVFIEDGTCSVSDSVGLFSIPGVEEGTHVVRIDPKTLPDDLASSTAGYFAMGVPGEYLIDLAPSGNRRVDFPLCRSIAEKAGRGSAAIGTGRPAVAVEEGSSKNDKEPLSPAVEAAESLNTAGTTQAGGLAGRTGYNAFSVPSSYFTAGSADLEEIPLRELAALNIWLREHEGWKISVAGYSDSIPISTADYPSNFELSLERARSVFQLLRMNGIPGDRMEYTGYGARFPVASNSTPEGRSLNRRVEIKVIPPEGYAEGDPDLPGKLSRPDTARSEFVLADDAGICAGIVSPDEGHIYTDRDKIDVEVKAPLASEVELYVNNIPVGREKIGRKEIDVGNGTKGFVFYGVLIKPGRNSILVVCRDHGDRNVCVRHVFLAGNPAGIAAETDAVSVPADGKSSPEIVFLVNDESGLPVRDGIFLTVTGPKELLAGCDVNPHQQGVQASTRGGRAVVRLKPSDHPRREKIHIHLGDLTGGCTVSYESAMRDWFLFGYAETDVGYSDLDGSGSTHRSGERHQDGLFAEGRISLYGQGEVKSGLLMTLSVDTRPIEQDKLLDRIEPEKYYPLYGDASDLRFNSASRSGTFVRVDNRSYSAMIGDFKTDLGTMEFTRYDRTFNGFEGEARFGRGSARGFVTRTDQATYQEEIPADGTSGFYFVEHYPLIENSEKIRIEVRNRYRPESIVKVDYKQVGRDYDINYMDGSILFKEPVATVDENLNPVTIVVSYECRSNDKHNFIYGLRAQQAVADSLNLGATMVLEEEGEETSSLFGFDLSGKLYRELSIESEYAHSEKFLLGSGDAFRVKLIGAHGRKLKWNTYYRNIKDNFFNPSFSGGKTELGSRKVGAELDLKIDDRFSLATKSYHHSFVERDEKKGYVDLAGGYRDGPVKGRAGFAAASHSDSRDGDQSTLLMLAAAGLERGKTRGEIQVDKRVAGGEVQEYPDRIQAGLTRKLPRKIEATLKHEYRTGKTSGSRHFTQIGLESSVNENLNLFSRYRVEGAMSGERGQATIGLKNRFRLSDALTSTFAVEKLATVSGSRTDDFTSFASGWLYTPEEGYKLKADYELRLEPDRRKHLVGIGGLKKLNENIAGLIKGDLWYCDEKSQLDRVKGSSTAGLSYRPEKTGPLTILSLFKTSYEKNSPSHPGAVDRDVTLMAEANYALNDLWELEGKLAGRWVQNCFKSYTASSSTFLYQFQVIRIIGSKWDVGMSARIVNQVETSTVRYGGGIEAGRIVAENIRVEAGYDFGGHRDGGTEINDFTRNGFHVGVKMKFNEKLLEYFHAGG